MSAKVPPATAPIRCEEPPLNKVQLVEILDEERNALTISSRSPHGLSQIYELCDRFLVVSKIFKIVILYEVSKRLPQIQFSSLFESQRDHLQHLLLSVLVDLH